MFIGQRKWTKKRWLYLCWHWFVCTTNNRPIYRLNISRLHFPRASLFILNHFSTCLSYRITVTPQLSTCSSWLCFNFSLYTCAIRYSECQVLCGHEVLSLFWIKWVNTFSEILFCFNKLLGFECMTVLCWSHGNPAHGRFTATYV